MKSQAFVVSFLTLAATSLVLNPSASAVEALAREAIAAIAETTEAKCSDGGSNHECPPIRNDSTSELEGTASSQSLIQVQIQAKVNNNNPKKDCRDKDGSIIVCPTATDS